MLGIEDLGHADLLPDDCLRCHRSRSSLSRCSIGHAPPRPRTGGKRDPLGRRHRPTLMRALPPGGTHAERLSVCRASPPLQTQGTLGRRPRHADPLGTARADYSTDIRVIQSAAPLAVGGRLRCRLRTEVITPGSGGCRSAGAQQSAVQARAGAEAEGDEMLARPRPACCRRGPRARATASPRSSCRARRGPRDVAARGGRRARARSATTSRMRGPPGWTAHRATNDSSSKGVAGQGASSTRSRRPLPTTSSGGPARSRVIANSEIGDLPGHVVRRGQIAARGDVRGAQTSHPRGLFRQEGDGAVGDRRTATAARRRWASRVGPRMAAAGASAREFDTAQDRRRWPWLADEIRSDPQSGRARGQPMWPRSAPVSVVGDMPRSRARWTSIPGCRASRAGDHDQEADIARREPREVGAPGRRRPRRAAAPRPHSGGPCVGRSTRPCATSSTRLGCDGMASLDAGRKERPPSGQRTSPKWFGQQFFATGQHNAVQIRERRSRCPRGGLPPFAHHRGRRARCLDDAQQPRDRASPRTDVRARRLQRATAGVAQRQPFQRGARRRSAEEPAASSIEEATAIAVSPASSLALQTAYDSSSGAGRRADTLRARRGPPSSAAATAAVRARSGNGRTGSRCSKARARSVLASAATSAALRDPDVHRRVAGNEPLRHQLGDDERRVPPTPPSRASLSTWTIEGEIVAPSSRRIAEGIPALDSTDGSRAGGNEEVGDRAGALRAQHAQMR